MSPYPFPSSASSPHRSSLYHTNSEVFSPLKILFLEARKHQDLYMWLSKPPNGPTVKFYVQNLHTLDELHFTGNCLKGSRPILSFDASFDTEPHLVLIKELLFQTFGVPPKARRTKPFVDRVMGFSFADGKVWIRNYEVKEAEKLAEKETDIILVEVGPRFCLTPIVIQEGSFGGPVIYQNRMFVSPNQLRADLRKDRKYHSRSEQRVERFAKEANLGLRTDSGMKAPVDVLDSSQLFA